MKEFFRVRFEQLRADVRWLVTALAFLIPLALWTDVLFFMQAKKHIVRANGDELFGFTLLGGGIPALGVAAAGIANKRFRARATAAMLCALIVLASMIVAVLVIDIGFKNQISKTTYGWIFGGTTIGGIILAIFVHAGFRTYAWQSHYRGTELIKQKEAVSRAKLLKTRTDEIRIAWAGLSLPERFMEGHLAVFGTPGSGKTLTLRALMETVLPQVGSRANWRAFVYDSKGDMLEVARKSGGPTPFVLNPFDTQCSAWAMAEDITDVASVAQIASIIVPQEPKGENQFFAEATRHLLAALLETLIQQGRKSWTLRDVVCIMQDAQFLTHVLSTNNRNPLAVSALKNYLQGDPKTTSNIMATVATTMRPFGIVASLWEHAEIKISLRDWWKTSTVLVLSFPRQLRAAMQAINRVVFLLLTDLVLSPSDSQVRRTWFFFDELADAGKLDGLNDLMKDGRSKGVRVAVGLQSIEALTVAYEDEHRAKSIVGLCGNVSVLRLSSTDTAKWAAERLGHMDVFEEQESTSPQGTSVSRQLVERESVKPAEFLNLPLVSNGQVAGYHMVPAIGNPFRAITRFTLTHLSETTATPRSPDEQMLKPLSIDDWNRLGFPPPPDEATGPRLDSFGPVRPT